MIYGYRGDQTIRRGPYGDPSPPALPIDVRGGHEQRKGDRIAKDWDREERRSKSVALHTGPESLKHLLHNRTAGYEAKKILLADDSGFAANNSIHMEVSTKITCGGEGPDGSAAGLPAFGKGLPPRFQIQRNVECFGSSARELPLPGQC